MNTPLFCRFHCSIKFGSFACSILLILGNVFLFSCSESPTAYTISGSFSESVADGEEVLLIDYDTQKNIDTTFIVDGHFFFDGEIIGSSLCQILVGNMFDATFVLEGGEIILHMSEKSFAEGTPLNERFRTYVNTLESMTSGYKGYIEETYNDNRENAVGYYAFIQLTADYSAPRMDSIVATAPKSLKEKKKVQDWIEMAHSGEKTAEGCMFVDFSVPQPDGSVVSLSDYIGRGEYVLLDFWASWCPPCIDGLPVLKAIYEKYSPKGLVILGVASWDRPEETLAAIEKYQIPWPQILNAQDLPMIKYGVSGIPEIILLSPDGRILERGLYGGEIEEKISFCYGAF